MIKRAVSRVLIVPLGFLLAGLMALLVAGALGLERFTQELHRTGGAADPTDLFWGLAAHWRMLVRLASAATLVPALGLVLVGEVARIRSSLFYILGGGAALAAVPLLAQLQGSTQVTAPPAAVWQVLATAGFAGGFVYWLIAGRTA
jgi:hypothetical protein